MAAPVPVLRVDWAGTGVFTDAIDTVHPLDDAPLSFTRGRSGDFTADAVGQISFTLGNSDDAYSPDRNWCDNPSFEGSLGAAGWSVAGVPGLANAGTSVTAVPDAAAGGGSSAGEVIVPAVANAGVAYPIPWHFRAGQLYSVALWLRWMSGSTAIQAGIGAVAVDPYSDLALDLPEALANGLGGIPVDVATGAGAITGSWVRYAFSWTPRFDTSAASVFVRATDGSAATFRVDAVQVNPGAVNPYIEAPTKGMLIPGRPVHFYASHLGINWPLFFGYLERLTPDPQAKKVTLLAYDILRRLSETDVVVPSNPFIGRSARDYRIAVLDDFERGNLNLLPNPHFATDTSSWTIGSGSATLTRATSDHAPVTNGATCGQFFAPSASFFVDAPVRLTPTIFAGQVYRATVWLKPLSGSNVWTVGLGGSPTIGSPVGTFQTMTLPWNTWTKVSVTYQVATTTPASTLFDGQAYFGLSVLSRGTGTVLIDGASVTRGQAMVPYAALSTAGRWPNFCGNGSFDGGLNGWYDGWANLCGNGSFEVNTTGWTGMTRDATFAFAGSWCGSQSVASTGITVTYGLTGTFKAGVRYAAVIQARGAYAGAGRIGIRSIGTPSDAALGTQANLSTGGWQAYSVEWVPTADRTDAQVTWTVVGSTGYTLYLDALMVYRKDALLTGFLAYADVGPGGGASPPTSVALSSGARYGSLCQSMVLPATALAGRYYDFSHLGPWLVAGQSYTASIWLRSSTPGTPIRLGLAACTAAGAMDEASTLATIGVGWTLVTVTWTPAADYPCSALGGVMLYVVQTDATARTIYLDGARVVPGATVDPFEQPYWDIPASAEPETYVSAAALSGTALACLTQLNGVTLTRHWIVADMQAPFWRYRAQDRLTYAAAASAEAYEAVQAITPPEIDRQAIQNLVTYSASGSGTDYEPAESSVLGYGVRPGPQVNGLSFIAAKADAVSIADALLARYSSPIRRPTITVENRWPSQLARDVNDMVWVTIAPWLVQGLFGNVARLTTTVDRAGQHWKTDYQLEESANPDGGYGSLAASLPE